MARILALEWDRREARLAVGSQRGKGIVVEQAFAVDLSPRTPDQPLDAPQIGERIAAALAARRIGRCETLVGVGRANIELRRLTLPPAPPEEFPDLVRFQALREFTSVSDDWSIDFVPLNGLGGEMANVLAAAISPRLIEQVQATCLAAGLTPARLTLRPFAAASLVARSRALEDDGSTTLLIDLLAEEADLTVLLGRQAAFVRTVLLSPSADVDRRADNLVAEIKRTMAAAQNQLDGRRVARAILCGDGQEHAALRERLASRLELPTEIFDPFAVVELASELSKNHPDEPGRFAPLLGMLWDQAAGERPAIDFFQPRRPPKARSKRTSIIAGSSALAAVAGAAAMLIWSQLAALDNTASSLQKQVKEAEKTAESTAARQKQTKEIGEFVASDINWLAEMREIAQQFPSADKALVTQLVCNVRNEGGGQIVIDGRAATSSTIPEISRKLTDGRREVASRGGQFDASQPTYPWRFSETITLPPVDLEAAPANAAPAQAGPVGSK